MSLLPSPVHNTCPCSVVLSITPVLCHQFAQTLVSQAHLSPLPLHVLPTYWGQDHVLSLHPTPDFIVLADRADPFTTTSNGATITNPVSQ